jgi:hypothetical protein
MPAPPTPVSLYATRWKPLLAALFFAGGVVVDVLYKFVWPTPVATAQPWMYQEPAKTVVFFLLLLVLAAFIVLGLYWTLTPRPLLQLTSTHLVYRPFPFPTRTIAWEDVDHVIAIAMRRDTSPVTHATFLTLGITLKRGRVGAYGGRQPLHLDLNLSNFSLQADELIHLIRSYHEVVMVPAPQRRAAKRTTRRRNHTPAQQQ